MVPGSGFGLWGRDLNGLVLPINWNSFWTYRESRLEKVGMFGSSLPFPPSLPSNLFPLALQTSLQNFISNSQRILSCDPIQSSQISFSSTLLFFFLSFSFLNLTMGTECLWAQSWHWELHVKDAEDATWGRDIHCEWGMPSSLYQNSREEKQTFVIHGEMGDQELLWEMLCPLGENSQEDLGSSLQGFLIFLAEHQNHRGVEEYIVLNDDEFIEEWKKRERR